MFEFSAPLFVSFHQIVDLRRRKPRHHQIDGRFLIRTGLHGVVGF